MKAAVYDHNGPPEVFRYADVPDPPIDLGDVLIQMEAISIEGGDVINRRSVSPDHPDYIVGYAGAGTVIAVGEEVTDRNIGDKVTLWGLNGSYAQFRAVPAQQTWLLPEGVNFAEAAVIPIGFGTAHHCLFARGKLTRGQTVLVQGASGGVGIAAVQLARQAGATVIAVTSTRGRVGKLLEIGASSVIDYSCEPVAEIVKDLTNGRGVDLVVDPVGATLATSLAVLRDEGTLVSVGNAGGTPLTLDLWPAVAGNRSIFGVFMGTILSRPQVRRTVDTMLVDLSKGSIVVPIDERFLLDRAAAAHRYIETHKIFGRVLLIP